MGISWSDEDRKNDMLNEAKAYMRKKGELIPNNDTQNVPEYFDEPRAAMRFFTIAYYDLNTEAKKRLYNQKFVIQNGLPYTYIERKRMSLLSPNNPFTQMKGESEDMVLNYLIANKDKVGLKRGGTMKPAMKPAMNPRMIGQASSKGIGRF